jgi:hypothetical protein
MVRTLDYSAVWNDSKALLRGHREGIGAIAGLFVFLPEWASRLFAGGPNLESAKTVPAMLAAYQEYISDNWFILLPAGLISLFGGVVIYALLTRKDLPTIGGALGLALRLLPLYFIAHLAAGFATFIGFLLLVIPGIYLSGRLTPLGAVVVGEPERSLSGAFSRTWDLTRNNGWSVFFLTLVVALVASLTVLIIGLFVGLVTRLAAGPEGVPFVETGISAALGAGVTTLMIVLGVAIYRHLAGQD